MNQTPSSIMLSYIARNEILKCVPEKPGLTHLIDDTIAAMPALKTTDETTLREQLLRYKNVAEDLSAAIVDLRGGKISVRNFGKKVEGVIEWLETGAKREAGLHEVVEYMKQLRDDVKWKVDQARKGNYENYDLGVAKASIERFHGRSREAVYGEFQAWLNDNFSADINTRRMLALLISKRGGEVTLDKLYSTTVKLKRSAIPKVITEFSEKNRNAPFKISRTSHDIFQCKPTRIRVPATNPTYRPESSEPKPREELEVSIAKTNFTKR